MTRRTILFVLACLLSLISMVPLRLVKVQERPAVAPAAEVAVVPGGSESRG